MSNNSESDKSYDEYHEIRVEQEPACDLAEDKIQSLLLTLKNRKSKFRLQAINLLAETRDERFIAPLIDAFIDSSSYQQEQMINSFVMLGPVVIKPLISNYGRMSDNAKLQTIHILRRLKHPDCISFFVSLINPENLAAPKYSSGAKNIAKKAVKALGKIAHPDSVGPLLEASKTKCLRQTALYGLRKVVNENPNWLIPHFDNHDIYIQKIAVQLVGDFQCQDAVEPLIALLKSSDLSMTLNILTALGKTGNPEAIDTLTTYLTAENANIRENTISALGQIGNTKALDSLVNCMSDSDPYVRAKVAWALGEIRSKDALPSIIRLSSDDQWLVRMNASTALGSIDDPGSLATLEILIRDKETLVVKAAIESIGRIGQSPQVDLLIPFTMSRSAGVRKTAIAALGEIGGGSAVDLLLRLLSEGSPAIKAEAALALGRSGDHSAVSHLRDSLCSLNPAVRIASKWAINYIEENSRQKGITYNRPVFGSKLFKELDKYFSDKSVHPFMRDLVIELYISRQIDNKTVKNREFLNQIHLHIKSLNPKDRKRIIQNIKMISIYPRIYGLDYGFWNDLTSRFTSFSEYSSCVFTALIIIGIICYILWKIISFIYDLITKYIPNW